MTQASSLSLTAPSGTSQSWSEDAELEAMVCTQILDTVRTHGYRKVSPPSFEPVELYTRLYGDDIRKRLLTFTTDQEYALRPDLTGGICRMIAEQLGAGGSLSTPLRFSASGSAFRYERLRPLRRREFHQIGIERVGGGDQNSGGDGHHGGDLEILSLARLALQACGLTGGLLRIGHAQLREQLLDQLPTTDNHQRLRIGRCLDQLSRCRDKFAHPRTGIDLAAAHQPESGERVLEPGQHPDTTHVIAETIKALGRDTEELDVSLSADALIKGLEALLHQEADAISLTPDERDALLGITYGAASLGELADTISPLLPDAETWLKQKLGHLDNCQDDFAPLVLRFNLGMVRGLGYYTGVTFEIDAPVLGPDVCQILGGGRFDNVIASLGGPQISAAGFAIGVERLCAALKLIHPPVALRNSLIPAEPLLLAFSEHHADQLLTAKLSERLKAEGAAVAIHPHPFGTELPGAEFIEKLRELPGRPYMFVILALDGEFHLAQLDDAVEHPTDLETLLMMFTNTQT